jgi:hypothetical protein
MGSAKGSQISEKYWGEVGKGKRVDVCERGLLKISVNETDTATSGLRWIFHMHSEFSRPAMCNNATWSSPLKCKVCLLNTDNCSNADYKNMFNLYRYTPRDISLFDCHIWIYLPGPPQTNWTRIVSERGLVKI